MGNLPIGLATLATSGILCIRFDQTEGSHNIIILLNSVYVYIKRVLISTHATYHLNLFSFAVWILSVVPSSIQIDILFHQKTCQVIFFVLTFLAKIC